MATTRIRGPSPPIAPQLELQRNWGAIASTVWGLILTELFPVYRAELNARQDQDGPPLPRSILTVLTLMDRRLVTIVPVSRLRRPTGTAGRATTATNAAAHDRQLSAALGIPVQVRPSSTNPLVREWIREATDKITSVRDGAIPGLRADLEAAWARGLTADELEQRWRSKGLPLEFGTIEGRTKVIARDQVNKLNGRLTELNQRAMGVNGYTWRRNAASNTRPSHRRRDGRRFTWNKPPPDGHPGQPVQCECHAEAVVRLETAVRQEDVTRAPGISTGLVVAAVGVALATGLESSEQPEV